MADLVQTLGFLNLRQMLKPTAFKAVADDVAELYAGEIFGIASATAARSNIDGDQIMGLAGWFELRRAVPAKVTPKGSKETVEVATAISRRAFLPSERHDAILAAMKALGDAEKGTLGEVQFATRVYLVRSGGWRYEDAVAVAPADPLVHLRAALAPPAPPAPDAAALAPDAAGKGKGA
jgi:hypothetical protein